MFVVLVVVLCSCGMARKDVAANFGQIRFHWSFLVPSLSGFLVFLFCDFGFWSLFCLGVLVMFVVLVVDFVLCVLHDLRRLLRVDLWFWFFP